MQLCASLRLTNQQSNRQRNPTVLEGHGNGKKQEAALSPLFPLPFYQEQLSHSTHASAEGLSGRLERARDW